MTVKEKNIRPIQKTIPILIALTLLMLFAVMPAAAADVTSRWADGSNLADTKVFLPNDMFSLDFTLDLNSVNEDAEFILTLANPDAIFGVGYTLIFPTGPIGNPEDPLATIRSHHFDNSSGEGILTLIIEPNAAIRFDIRIGVVAAAGNTYNNETAIITAQLTQGGQTSVSDSATVRVEHPSRLGRATQVLLSPGRFSTGENTYQLNLQFNPLSGSGLRGQVMQADSITFDFSDTIIYANGSTRTLSEWSAAGIDMMTFLDSSNAVFNVAVDNNLHTVTFSRVNSQPVLMSSQAFPMTIQMHSEFTDTPANPTAPFIHFRTNFSAVNMTGNGRGPVIDTFIQTTGPHPDPNNADTYGWLIIGSSFTAVTADAYNVEVVIRPPVNLVSHARPIVNSSTGIFEFQNLFTAQITNAELGGSDEIFDFKIPMGATITHIRPPVAQNQFTDYSGMFIWDRANNTFVPLTPGQTNNLTEFGFMEGETITLKITDLVRINADTAGHVAETFPNNRLIIFIGQVNTSSNPSNLVSFTFDAVLNATGSSVVNREQHSGTITIRDNYVVTPAFAVGHFLTGLPNRFALADVPTTVRHGDTFYMFAHVNPSTAAHYSVLRFDPMNPINTAAMSNPVFYFSVPPGLIAGDPEVTDASGNPLELRTFPDSQRVVIHTRTFVNDGYFGAQGGSLVEVKFDLENNPQGETFWITQRNMHVRLPVQVSDDFDGAGFTFPQQSVLFSTWDPNAFDSLIFVGTSPLLSTIVSSQNLSQIAASVPRGVSPTTAILTHSVQLEPVSAVSVTAAVRVPTGFISFRDGSADSFPQLNAGSPNEQFRISLSNRLTGGDIVDTGTLYFVLPVNDEWRPHLHPVSGTDLNITLLGGFARSDLTLFYTTDVLTNTETISSMQSASWSEINSSSISTIVWDDVTAIRSDFSNVAGEAGFNIFLDFYLPNIRVADLAAEDTLARGQTLYVMDIIDDSSLGYTLFLERGRTAAIQLVPSLAPQIVTASGTAFTNANVEYRSGSVPSELYSGFIIRDDFTHDVALASITITHQPPGSSVRNPVHSFEGSALSGVVTQTAGTWIVDSQTFGGHSYTLNTLLHDYIRGVNNTLGTHFITLVSTEDNDLNRGDITFSITVYKDASKVILTPNTVNISFLMDPTGRLPLMLPGGSIATPVPYNWTAYMSHFVDVDDYGDPHISARFVPADNSTFGANITIPGLFRMNLSYISPGVSPDRFISLPVTVILYDDLTIRANAGGSFLNNLVVYVDYSTASLPLQPIAFNAAENGYVTRIRANFTHPTVAAYEILYSGFPRGLKDVTIGSTQSGQNRSVSFSSQFGTPEYTRERVLNFEPVEIEALAAGQLGGIVSVALYREDTVDERIEKITQNAVSPLSAFIFEPLPGTWFEDGKYYISVTLKPGFEMSAASGFTQNSANHLIWTGPVTELNHLDLEFQFTVEQNAMISGHIWHDNNRDSVMDAGESGISTRVDLLDAGGAVLNTTTTDSHGFYFFDGLDENNVYIIEVTRPTGFNSVSALINDQSIDTDLRASVDFSGAVAHITVNAGFYNNATSGSGGGGSGYGQATIVNPAATFPPSPEVPSPGYETPPPVVPETPEPESRSLWWLLLLLVIVSLIIIAVVYKKRKKD